MKTLVHLKENFEVAYRSNLPVVTSKMLQNYFLKAENFEDPAKDTYDDRNGKILKRSTAKKKYLF